MDGADPLVLVMAGGSGTRFWPRSRRTLPKQFLPLFSKRTLIQETVDRVRPLVPASRIFVCASESQQPLLRKQLPDIGETILEPESKNTAPCLMLSTRELLNRGFSPDTVMVVLPADHYISDVKAFQDILAKAIEFARQGPGLITLGIFPTHPHTGYGYIEAGDPAGVDGVFRARRFVEKPNRMRAEKYLKSRNYYWNGGIFIWTLHAITEAFQQHMPREWELMQSHTDPADLNRIYAELPATPIDVGVLEKATNVFLLPADIGWNDIGSWGALYDLQNKTPQDHVVLGGDVKSVQSRGCLVDAPAKRVIALVGVENLIVVENEEYLLIADRSQDQLVREAAKELDPPK